MIGSNLTASQKDLFSDQDRIGLKKHLPLHVKAVSVREKIIPADETWDLSIRGEHWNLDEQEELYVIANVGRLIMEPGASLIIRGNLFFLLCQEVDSSWFLMRAIKLHSPHPFQ